MLFTIWNVELKTIKNECTKNKYINWILLCLQMKIFIAFGHLTLTLAWLHANTFNLFSLARDTILLVYRTVSSICWIVWLSLLSLIMRKDFVGWRAANRRGRLSNCSHPSFVGVLMFNYLLKVAAKPQLSSYFVCLRIDFLHQLDARRRLQPKYL